MKRKLQRALSCLLALALLTCPVLAISSFPDVDEDADYAEAVEYLNEIGIMQGDEKGNFNPDKAVTRAEMAAIVCRMLGMTEDLPMSSAFSDVPASHWANQYVGIAAELGIVGGYGNGKFGPSDPVTYEQAVTMVIRAVGGEPEAVDVGGYPDGYISVAEENGLLNGISSRTGDPMSRADVAVILYNCLG